MDYITKWFLRSIIYGGVMHYSSNNIHSAVMYDESHALNVDFD